MATAPTCSSSTTSARSRTASGTTATPNPTPKPPVCRRAAFSPMSATSCALLSNAIKFTEPDGAISVAVELVDAERVAVNIGDTGIGMAPDEIPIALAPFEQIDNNLPRRYQGTGLGLPLAKALVELQGGDLAISSEPGKGTLVRVSLRRHLPAANELNAAHPV